MAMDQAVKQIVGECVAIGAHLATHEDIMAQVKALLAGQPLPMQATVLGECLALWLVSHPDYLRPMLLQQHVALVEALLPSVEREVFKGGTHPASLGRAE